MANAVDIKNLSVEFRTDNGIVKALNNLDLSIAHGKMSTATVPGGHTMVISSAMFYFSNYYFFGEKK